MPEPKEAQPDQAPVESKPILKPGLNAVFAPNLSLGRESGVSRGFEQTALTKAQAQERMDNFLEGINNQGGRIVSSIAVEVQDNIMDTPSNQTMFIIDKPQAR